LPELHSCWGREDDGIVLCLFSLYVARGLQHNKSKFPSVNVISRQFPPFSRHLPGNIFLYHKMNGNQPMILGPDMDAAH
jgi:hypothetical protein